ncbi:hypothetical protein JTB14_023018 [Gonioctena quinquepunctata]|nr:hypothetical protein JTB14_023018 [Gonioctena quinquepunctata]
MHKKPDQNLWDRRMGHINFQGLRKLEKLSEAYRLYDPETERVLTSRDVIFFENLQNAIKFESTVDKNKIFNNIFEDQMITEDKEKAVSDVRDVSSAENDCLPSDFVGSNESVMESHAHRYENILPSPDFSGIEPLKVIKNTETGEHG